jgi:hypothetical protein
VTLANSDTKPPPSRTEQPYSMGLMKFLQIPLCIFLIPALIAGAPGQPLSSSAKALLKKPRTGYAEITWQDGRHDHQTQIVRVTNSFISLRKGASATCENVDLSRIASVDWGETGEEFGTGFLGDFLAAAAAIPILLVMLPIAVVNGDLNAGAALELLVLIHAAPVLVLWHPIGEATRAISSNIALHDSALGNWESASSPGNAVERIQMAPTKSNPPQVTIARHLATIRAGHYRVEGTKLYMRYDDAKDNETFVSIRFECERLVADNPKAFPVLYAEPRQGRAQAPIVGRWSGGYGASGPNSWEFRPDGTFQGETIQTVSGSYKRVKGGADILWLTKKEHWDIRSANGSLFITRDAKTTEFKRRAQIY